MFLFSGLQKHSTWVGACEGGLVHRRLLSIRDSTTHVSPPSPFPRSKFRSNHGLDFLWSWASLMIHALFICFRPPSVALVQGPSPSFPDPGFLLSFHFCRIRPKSFFVLLASISRVPASFLISFPFSSLFCHPLISSELRLPSFQILGW